MNGIAIPNGVATPAKPTATSPPTLNDSRVSDCFGNGLDAELLKRVFAKHY